MPPGHTHDSGEVYEWPGGYTEYADGENYARIRLEQQLSAHTSMQGLSNHCGLTPGFTFTLKNYPRDDQNQQYLLVGVAYEFEENSQVSGSSGQGGSMQRFSLVAQPTTRAFNPPKATPKPLALGTQTAWVVGPPGCEIHTDQYGRIKVQFHWDRIGAMDDNSSCWMRVLTPWAGPTFGMIHIPRVGFEVMVGFENSDPDRPVVMGCLYNANNMPPWALPANATQSGIKTRSSKGGVSGDGIKNGPGDANALRFEDKAGAEQVWLHAQKDQLIEVEHDEDHWVGHDRRKNVDHDETTVIGNDRTETVMHDETITVHNNRVERVDVNEKISIGDNRTEDVGLNETIAIGKNRTETVGDNESVTVGKNQTFTIGDNRTKSVGKNESDSIGKNWSISVAKMKTETVGIGAMQNIGIFRMVNIGAAYNLNVGAVMMTNVGMIRMDTVGMNWSRNAGINESLTVGANQTTTAGQNIAHTAGQDIALAAGANSTSTAGANLSMMAGAALSADGATVAVTAANSLTLTCGGSTIVMTPGSIEIKSPVVLINP
jgi:type VI secretion system secreted protein VgrG